VRRILTALVLTAAAAMALIPSAAAAAEIRAPYARAGVDMSSSGEVLFEKNIERAWKPENTTGRYCVTVAPSVDVTQAFISVSEKSYRSSHHYTTANNACGLAANTVYIVLTDEDRVAANGSFVLIVH
jgi:hypothetical protein